MCMIKKNIVYNTICLLYWSVAWCTRELAIDDKLSVHYALGSIKVLVRTGVLLMTRMATLKQIIFFLSSLRANALKA